MLATMHIFQKNNSQTVTFYTCTGNCVTFLLHLEGENPQ